MACRSTSLTYTRHWAFYIIVHLIYSIAWNIRVTFREVGVRVQCSMVNYQYLKRCTFIIGLALPVTVIGLRCPILRRLGYVTWDSRERQIDRDWANRGKRKVNIVHAFTTLTRPKLQIYDDATFVLNFSIMKSNWAHSIHTLHQSAL